MLCQKKAAPNHPRPLGPLPRAVSRQAVLLLPRSFVFSAQSAACCCAACPPAKRAGKEADSGFR